MQMIDGIYTAYLAGPAGTGLLMLVFKAGKIAGADLAGITMSGTYVERDGLIDGEVRYTFPAETASITGFTSGSAPQEIIVPISLPSELSPEETYRIATPIGPINAKIKKNCDL